jgi:hypothetical protein
MGSMTFSTAVSVGRSWKNWNTTPTLRPRQRASTPSDASWTEAPATRTSPSLGRSMPPTRFSSVDLPLPDLPTTATRWPRSTARSTSLRATKSPAGVAYLLPTRRSAIIGSIDPLLFGGGAAGTTMRSQSIGKRA